jgi:hypothetical protein
MAQFQQCKVAVGHAIRLLHNRFCAGGLPVLEKVLLEVSLSDRLQKLAPTNR